jgi:hypothetical protein
MNHDNAFRRNNIWSWIHAESDKWCANREMFALWQTLHLLLCVDGGDVRLCLAWLQQHHDYHKRMLIALCELPDTDAIDRWSDKFNAHEKERWTAYRLMESIREWERLRNEEELDTKYPEYGMFCVTDDPYRRNDPDDYTVNEFDWLIDY